MSDNSLRPMLSSGKFDKMMDGETAEVQKDAWDFKSTLSFWVAVYMIIGSFLFLVGSLAMFNIILPKNFNARFWVDYSYMVGAWCFTLANYVNYFNVMNKMSGHGLTNKGNDTVTETPKLRFLKCPSRNLGELAVLLNLLGAFAYNVNTMTMFCVQMTNSDLKWEAVYVTSGCGGSVLFVLGGLLELEYNHWRPFTRKSLSKLPNVAGMAGTLGAAFYFVGYFSFHQHAAEKNPYVADEVWVSFSVGSVGFLISSWIPFWMWKAHNFGLGFATELQADDDHNSGNVKVNGWQQAMMIVYSLSLAHNWVLFALHFGEHRNGWDTYEHIMGVCFRLSVYHCILSLMSAIHELPSKQPYKFLMHVMRYTALFDIAWHGIYIVYAPSNAPPA